MNKVLLLMILIITAVSANQTAKNESKKQLLIFSDKCQMQEKKEKAKKMLKEAIQEREKCIMPKSYYKITREEWNENSTITVTLVDNVSDENSRKQKIEIKGKQIEDLYEMYISNSIDK
jgi:hypothetical protein